MLESKALRLPRCVFINLHLVNPVAEFCIAHFQETYNIRIRYADKFSINISSKNNPHLNIISAELCEVIQGQVYKRKVPEGLTMKVVKFSKIKPQDHFRKISQKYSIDFGVCSLNHQLYNILQAIIELQISDNSSHTME